MSSNPAFKSKYVSLNIEDIVEHTRYAFSYNPQQQFEDQVDRFCHFYKYIEELFYSLKSTCNITLYPEISKLGRLHVHGTIKILKPLEFYLHTIKTLMKHGTFEIDIINDDAKWQEYCTKQKTYLEAECKDYKLPYPITSATIYNRKQDEIEATSKQTRMSKNILKLLSKK